MTVARHELRRLTMCSHRVRRAAAASHCVRCARAELETLQGATVESEEADGLARSSEESNWYRRGGGRVPSSYANTSTRCASLTRSPSAQHNPSPPHPIHFARAERDALLEKIWGGGSEAERDQGDTCCRNRGVLDFAEERTRALRCGPHRLTSCSAPDFSVNLRKESFPRLTARQFFLEKVHSK
eukprot:2315305-Rhodomonas_salina.2